MPGFLQFAAGSSVGLLGNKLIATGLLGADVQGDEQFQPNFLRAGAGPEVHLQLSPTRWWSVGSSAIYRQWWVSSQPQSLTFEHSMRFHLSKVTALNFSAMHTSSYLDVQAKLMIYY